MFKVTVTGKTLAEVQDQIEELYNNLHSGLTPQDETGVQEMYDQPKDTTPSVPHVATVPHVYPVPDTAQEAHDELEQAASPNAFPASVMPFPSSVAPSNMIPAQASSPAMNAAQSIPATVSQPLSSDRDSRGMPYDARIHSTSRAFNKDGSWRTRRNLDENTLRSVESELRGSFNPLSVPAPAVVQVAPSPVVPPMPSAAVQVEMPNFAQPQAAPIAQPQVAPQAAPNYDVPVVPATATKPAHTFESFLQRFIPTMAELIAKKVISQEYVQQLCTHYGVKEIWEIQKDAVKARELFDGFVGYGFITAV